MGLKRRTAVSAYGLRVARASAGRTVRAAAFPTEVIVTGPADAGRAGERLYEGTVLGGPLALVLEEARTNLARRGGTR